MSNSHGQYTLGPFIILTFIYFIVGFLTTINGQFQGPLQIAFLSRADLLRNTLTTLLSFFFFLGYLLNSGVAGKWVDRHGYQVTLVRSLYIMVIGLMTYGLSAWMGSAWPGLGIPISADWVPWAYFVFLCGCFLMGTSAAMLQVVINPYIASYQLPGTSPIQRMNIATGVNSIGTTIGPFFVTLVIFAGVSLESVRPGQILSPVLWIAIVVAIIALVTRRMNLPDLSSIRSTVQLPRSVWSFSHLALGVFTIFLYVGAEVSIGVNINLHAMQLIKSGSFPDNPVILLGLKMAIPALLATLYWGGMMVGRLAFTAFPKISPRWLLAGTTSCAALLIIWAMIQDNLYLLSAVGLCHSVMWGCIFTLAVAGLGGYTSRASGAFMMGVFGGAILPLLQGIMADYLGSWRWTWSLCVICELAMLAYAIWGSRVKDPEALANMAVPPDPGS